MPEQLLVVGLGIGEDADAAWFLSGLSLESEAVPEPPTFDPPFGSGLVNLQRGGSLVTTVLQRGGSLVNDNR